MLSKTGACSVVLFQDARGRTPSKEGGGSGGHHRLVLFKAKPLKCLAGLQ